IQKIKMLDGNSMFPINTKESLELGDAIRIHSAKDKKRESVKIDFIVSEENGYLIPAKDGFDVGDAVYLIMKKREIRKYPHIIPNSLSKYKRHPGISLAPVTKTHNLSKNSRKIFKDGIYIKTANFNDFYVIQSVKPEKIIFTLDKSNFVQLKNNINSIPFKKSEIIIYLKPFFPEDDEIFLEEALEFLVKNGFTDFIVNNLGHISLLRNRNLNLIVGDYLYVFNNYAGEFFIDNGADFIVVPYESNKKNIISLAENLKPERLFATVFAYPELFRIKADLTKLYNFEKFADSKENEFYLKRKDDETFVIPDKPFSIIDKISQLEKIGIKKIIADLSYISLTKNYYKTIMKTIENREIIEKFTRFNFKEGFYREND
ncbi:MAG TPA: hypothetical protein PLO89_04220, partial [Spirochaetota bacterium]|nr:hypothetical protein [Spirochaetota bacterium]